MGFSGGVFFFGSWKYLEKMIVWKKTIVFPVECFSFFFFGGGFWILLFFHGSWCFSLVSGNIVPWKKTLVWEKESYCCGFLLLF